MQDNCNLNNDEYISIYKLGELFGKSVNSLKQLQSRSRLIQQLENFPYGTFEKKILNSSAKVAEDLPEIKALYSRRSIDIFFTNYISLAEIAEILNITIKEFYRLNKRKRLQVYRLGNVSNQIFISRVDFQMIKVPYDESVSIETQISELMDKGYISIYEIGELLGMNVQQLKRYVSYRRYLIQQLENFPEGTFERKTFNLPRKKYKGNPTIDILYTKISIEKLFSNYISLAEIIEVFNFKQQGLNKTILISKIRVYALGQEIKLKFISRVDFDKIKSPNDELIVHEEEMSKWIEKGYISIYEIVDLFGIGNKVKSNERSKNLLINNIDNLPNNVIKKIELENPIFINKKTVNEVYQLGNIISFKENSVDKVAALNMLNITEGKLFDSLVLKYKIQTYKFGNKREFKFYLRSDILRISKDDLVANSVNVIMDEQPVSENGLNVEIHNKEDEALSNLSYFDNSLYENTKDDWKVMGYISAYEIDKNLGKTINIKRLTYYSYRPFVEKLPNGVFNFIRLKQPIKIEEELPVVNELYSVESLKQFLSEYVNRKEAAKLLGCEEKRLSRLVNKYAIRYYRLDHRQTFYSLEHIKNTLNYIEKKIIGKKLQKVGYMKKDNNDVQLYDRTRFVSIYEIIMYIGKKRLNGTFISNLKMQINNLPKNMIEVTEIPIRLHDNLNKRYIDVLYSRKDVDDFFRKHISKKDAFEKLLIHRSEKIVHKYYSKLKISEIRLGGQQDTIFISKYHFNKLMDTILKKSYSEKYLNPNEVRSLLNISDRTYEDLVSEKRLVPIEYFRNAPLFEKKKLKSLMIEKQKLLETAMEYYTSKEIKEKYGVTIKDNIRHNASLFNAIPVAPLIRMDLNITNHSTLYKKIDVDAYHKECVYRNTLSTTSIPDRPFQEFIYKLESIIKFEFNENQIHTKSVWYQYINKALINQKYDSHSITNLAKITEMVFNRLTKDLYTYKAHQINFLVLNENYAVPKTFQKIFFEFLRNYIDAIGEVLPIPFSLNELNNPSDYEKLIDYDYSIYSTYEYQQLYEYANNIDLHKNRAIMDAKLHLEINNEHSKTKIKNYDSYWLYILVQLTNNWRHGTVITQIPRVDLSKTSIRSLDWLFGNNPTIEDANIIIFQIGRYVTKITKTGLEAEEIFIVGEPLKIAFASAAAICEFRRQALSEDDPKLIGLDVNTSRSKKSSNVFFNKFNKEFVFSNRKMNRTLATLIYSVLRHLGKGLNEARTSRSHLNEKTTMNHYIKLSDQQVTVLVNELFDRNDFGYITQIMTDILYGPESNKIVETKRMIALNNEFGDADKINVTAGLLDLLATRRDEVVGYIKELDIDELQSLQRLALAGMLPSKQQYYQCIYAECRYVDEYGEKPACESCPASIVNVYALSNLMDNYLYYLHAIVDNFDNSKIGEQKKLANHFHIVYQKVYEARNKFGRDVVDGFIDGGEKRLKSLGQLINSKKLQDLRTIVEWNN